MTEEYSNIYKIVGLIQYANARSIILDILGRNQNLISDPFVKNLISYAETTEGDFTKDEFFRHLEIEKGLEGSVLKSKYEQILTNDLNDKKIQENDKDLMTSLSSLLLKGIAKKRFHFI
ncbi:MAG: hypothetical protein LBG48_00265 [Rickettsiales bacterium]|jgi:hypothetical protein|nr:hypothetical protein [Rickettsiales bacterium]